MTTKQDHRKNITALKTEMAFLALPLLPSSARREFSDLLLRLFKEERGLQLHQMVRCRHSTLQLCLVADQRDACQRFVEGLLKAGLDHDPEFFKSYCASFERLRQEIYVEPPTEEDVRAEVIREFQQGLGENCPEEWLSQ